MTAIIDREQTVATRHTLRSSRGVFAEWSTDSPAEMRLARNLFDRYRRSGVMMYALDSGGGSGEMIREFDPNVDIHMQEAYSGG